MPIKKSDLYASLWASCDELRGSMDASQYKDYVLTFLFVKYLSDKYAGRDDTPVVIPPGGSFADMVAAKNTADIGDRINKIIAALAEANGLKGVIDLTDFNDEEKLGKGKEMVDRLTRLVGIFENPALNFSRNRADGDDLLGDAYEYLMRHFATESGKSKGQFYTPAEVSRVLASVVGAGRATSQEQTVYDPTCGSGSLLLKVADEAPRGLTIYGQENDNATKALAVMNMWMHGYPSAEIHKGNTLAQPQWKDADGALKKFDFVVANPPFSYKAWRTGMEDEPLNDRFQRFAGFGVPPEKNGDYAFLLHIVRSLKSTGKAACILPHGVLFRGGAEAEIRRNLVERGYILGIIGLPANLFYGTGIPACVLVLDKEGAAERTGIFMVDASRGYIKDGNKNRLREQDIHRIVDVFSRQTDTPKYARRVPLTEVQCNDYNLNLPRYIDSQDDEDVHDLTAHLRGGLPARDVEALAAYWDVFPSLRAELFENLPDRANYYALRADRDAVKTTIFEHPEFLRYRSELDAVFENWIAANMEHLRGINGGTHPRPFIDQLAESLLGHYAGRPLVDHYAVYQHLLDYWLATMKDDVYLLVEEGWKATLEPVRDAKGKVRPGEYECPLIPRAILVAAYFPELQADVERREQELEALARELEELAEEHDGEEGLLAEVTSDKGKVTAAAVKARLAAIKKSPADADERAVLERWKALADRESTAKAELKAAQSELDRAVLAQYPRLTPAEVQTLVVDHKWLPAVRARVQAEIDGLCQRLAARVQELADRYATPLPEIEAEVAALTGKVKVHLEKMGVAWN